MSLIAAVAAIMLPIETKGREMKVTLIYVCVCFYVKIAMLLPSNITKIECAFPGNGTLEHHSLNFWN